MNALVMLAGLAMAQDLAIVGEVVYPVSGDPVANGVVLVEDGRITAVGVGLDIPEGTRTLNSAVVTPGLIDGLSVIGLSGVQNRSPDQDHRETYEPRLAQLRALDGFHPADSLVGYVKEFGITTVRTGPSPGCPWVGARWWSRPTVRA